MTMSIHGDQVISEISYAQVIQTYFSTSKKLKICLRKKHTANCNIMISCFLFLKQFLNTMNSLEM